MNEYHTKLINLRVRKVTAKNYFTLSSLVEDYDKLVEELTEDKEKNKFMTSLWEAVEYNEQLEQKFDDIVEHLKLSKRKGYKMNFDSSEKLKNINTTIQELLKEETIMTTQQDQDVLLADQFSEAINNLIEEILPLIDTKNLYYIINLKLKRLFEEFKDTTLYSCHYDEFREAIISKIKLIIKKEEDKKKENPTLTEFTKALKDIKRDSDVYSMRELLDKLNIIHCLYGSILNLSLDDVKKKYFELSSK